MVVEVPSLAEEVSIQVEPSQVEEASRSQEVAAYHLGDQTLLLEVEACEVCHPQVEVALVAWGGLLEVQVVGVASLLEEVQGEAYILLLPSYWEEVEQERWWAVGWVGHLRTVDEAGLLETMDSELPTISQLQIRVFLLWSLS